MRIALLRHGPTEWNAEKRVQGSIDTPLSPEGEAKMATLLVPEGFDHATAYCSPRRRTRQTAACLGLRNPAIDIRLEEQNWGDWEGLTIAEIKARHGDDAFLRAGSGLCFRPPGGESTGEVHARLGAFFAEVAARGEEAIAVTHAGVLRAAYTLATGWDMSAPYPAELDLQAALILTLAPMPSIAQLNAPLRNR